MKLPVTSFFFLIFFIFLISCDTKTELSNDDTKHVEAFKNKISTHLKAKENKTALLYLDSLRRLAEEKNDHTLKSYVFQHFAQCYNAEKKRGLAVNYADSLGQLAEKMNDSVLLAISKWRKGFYYRRLDSLQKSISNYEQYKNIHLELGNRENAGRASTEISNILKAQGNYGVAELAATEGINLLKNTNDFKNISGLYQVLAVASKETEKLKVAKDHIHKALTYAVDSITGKKRVHTADFLKIKNTQANIYKASGELDNAVTIYQELLKLKEGDTLEIKRINANLAETLFLKNGFNQTSDSLLQNSLAYLLRTEKSQSALFSTYVKLAKLYKPKNNQQALNYINAALKIAEGKANESSIYEALEIKFGILYPNKEFDQYAKLRKKIDLQKENINTLYVYERFNYEEEEREKIEALKEKAETENKFLLVSLILLIVILATFLLYQKIKRRHKIEKVKTVHNTEVRISAKVHDELANDIHHLLAQVETSEPNKDILLDKLDTIYHNARDISKQNRSIETGKTFPDELDNLFRSYQSDAVNIILKRYDTAIWSGISSHIKITVYRVLQELLTNMKKHSNATLVAVSIQKKKKQLFIEYKDNGKGFSKEISKNGLQNAENRIHAIKGKLTFDTKLHQGCTFSINVPL